jgi:hypothetical protein
MIKHFSIALLYLALCLCLAPLSALAAFAPFMLNGPGASPPPPPPSVAVTAPAAGTVTGTITVSATCTATCTQVLLQVNAATIAGGTCTTAPVNTCSASYDTTLVVNGNYTVTAVGTNAGGTTTSSGVAITINNVVVQTAIFDATQLGSTGNTLDASSTVVTQGGACGAQFCSARTVAASDVGKYYWEMTDTIDAGGKVLPLLASGAVRMFGTSCSGTDCLGYASNGALYIAGPQVATLQTWAQGNTIAFAVDFTALKIWVKVIGGNWDNNANDDPATGAGGYSIAALTGAPWFIVASLYGTAGTKASFNFGARAYAGTVPSGFLNWPVSDLPIVTAGTNVNYTTNTTAVPIDTTLTINNAPTLGSATVQITGGYLSGDTLACPLCVPPIAAAYNASASGGGLLTLTGPATEQQYQNVLRSVTFFTAAAAGTRTITWIVSFPAAGPAIGTLAPTTGTTAGGTTVTVNGVHFTGATEVDFGTTPGTALSVASDTQLNIVSPAAASAGTVDVRVTAGGLISPLTANDQFVYTATSSYSGPGDNGVSFARWYGTRAYARATAGQPLMNVCVNNDAACQDLYSSATGDLVPAVIGSSGITCPDNLGTCTVKTLYDLVHNSTANPSAGVPLTQPTIASRPSVQSKVLPILGSTRACIFFPDGVTYLQSSVSSGIWPSAYPVTLSGVFQSNATGNRAANVGPYPIAFGATNATPSINFAGASAQNGYANPPNQVRAYAGSSAYVTQLDGMPHAIQATVASNGTSSNMMVDGIASTSLNTGNTISSATGIIMGWTASGNAMEGVICEAGMATNDASASALAINTNQTNYYLTANTTLTAVTDYIVDFDSNCTGGCPTQGTQVTYPVQQKIFHDSSVTAWANLNYVWASGNSASQPVNAGCQYPVTPSTDCIPGTSILAIAAGKTGNGLAVTLPTGNVGYMQDGYGQPQMIMYMGGGGFNVIDLEWDEQEKTGWSIPQGGCGGCVKIGLDPVFWIPSGTNQGGTQEGGEILGQNCYSQGCPSPTNTFWIYAYSDDNIPGTTTTCPQLGYTFPCYSGGNTLQAAYNNINNSSGWLSVGTWYHYHIQLALGPHGWYLISVQRPTDTSPTLWNAVTRGNPHGCYENGALCTATPAWDIIPHYGGQCSGGVGSSGCDAPTNNSTILFDNIHVKLFQR